MGLTVDEFVKVYCQSDPSGGLVLNVDASNNDLSAVLTTSNSSGGRSVKVNIVAGGGTAYIGTANRITVSGSTIDIAATYVGQTSITTLGTIGTGIWHGTAIADAYISSAATWNAKESALTFSNGVTRTANTIKNDLITGKSGGQIVIGGTADGDVLSFKNTSGDGTISPTSTAYTFLTGNNGSIVGVRIRQNGDFSIGNRAYDVSDRAFQINQAFTNIQMGSFAAIPTLPGIWMNALPDSTNYILASDGAVTLINGKTDVYYRVNNATIMHMSATGLIIGGDPIDATAILQLDSTTKGLRTPRMTTAQRTAMANVTAIHVYDTDLNQAFYSDGTNWIGY